MTAFWRGWLVVLGVLCAAAALHWLRVVVDDVRSREAGGALLSATTAVISAGVAALCFTLAGLVGAP